MQNLPYPTAVSKIKVLFKHRYAIILLLLIQVGISGCVKDGDGLEVIDPTKEVKAGDATIKSILQRTTFNSDGETSSVILLSGISFDKRSNDNKAFFNDIPATSVTGDSLSLRVGIPKAVMGNEVSLKVIVNGKSYLLSQPLKIDPIIPVMTNLSTDAVMRGGKLIISGGNFSPVKAKNAVTVNGIAATIDSVATGEYDGGYTGVINKDVLFAVDRKIDCGRTLYITVPQNAGTGKVVVTSYGMTSAAKDLTIVPGTFTVVGNWYGKSITLDAAGNLYGVSANTVVKITPTGVPSILATIGDSRSVLGGCVADAAGNVYVTSGTDYDAYGKYFPTDQSSKVFKVTAGGVVSTFAGSNNGVADGQGTAAQFKKPTHIVRNERSGNLYVNDGAVIRKITPSGMVSTLASISSETYGLVCDAATGDLYVLDNSYTGGLKKITESGAVSVVPNSGNFSAYFAKGVAMDPSGGILVASYDKLYRVKDGQTINTYLNPLGKDIGGMTVSPSGQIYIVVYDKGYKLIKVTP